MPSFDCWLAARALRQHLSNFREGGGEEARGVHPFHCDASLNHLKVQFMSMEREPRETNQLIDI